MHDNVKARTGDVFRTGEAAKCSQANHGNSLRTSPSTPPSCLAPESFETTSQTSRKWPSESNNSSEDHPSDSKPPNDVGKSIEKAVNPRRRPLPNPVETSSRSSKKPLPEPVETSACSRNLKNKPADHGNRVSSARKLLPEPVETTAKHRGGVKEKEQPGEAKAEKPRQGTSRKFKPELIETAKGSRRRAEMYPHNGLGKGLPSPLRPHLSPPRTPAPPANTPILGTEVVPDIHASRFSAANLAKRQEKQHCYTVPELPPIESDSSEDSGGSPSGQTSSMPPSSTYGSVSGPGTSGEFDKKFSAYMLSLAARAAEQQLRDQAMAAYPNEMFHEPVDHFAMNDDSRRPSIDMGKVPVEDAVDLKKFRRESAADLELELEYMRRHHDEQDQIKEVRATDIGESKFSAAAIAAKLAQAPREPSQYIGGHHSGFGIKTMRSAASPPMLGGDLVFPFSLSPKTTRCDPDQFPVPRTGEADVGGCQSSTRLWHPAANARNTGDEGLWMGLCQKSNKLGATLGKRKGKLGIMTPNADLEEASTNVRAVGSVSSDYQLPSTPSASSGNPPADRLDKKLCREKEIEEEFDDAFVTQIYNYLSMGFSSLARPFDDELSKISRIPVTDLRRDDLGSNAKGYIGTPEGSEADEDPGTGRMRWTALKFYIQEWFRQSSDMAENFPDDWGARVRRGSWAW